MHLIRSIGLLALFSVLSGCKLVVMDPSGDVASQQSDLIIYATILMLIVIVPVMALTVFFAFYYRKSNKDAAYEPDWDHSISLEIVVWSVPLAIIICLAGLTWVATHRLDPYEPLRRVSEDIPIDPEVEPLVVHVVSMDWKWLFIYPEQGIATVNEAAAIVNRPVEFRLTSATVMNSFYVPALAGMIYSMAGMETELNAVINKSGVYDGFSSNYSGEGFSHMRFKFHGLDEDRFSEWVQTVRSGAGELTREAYVDLEKPSIDHPVTYFGGVEDGLWDRILNMCVDDDTLCLNDMMMVDALGGGGIEGLFNRELFKGFCAANEPGELYEKLRPSYRGRAEDVLATLSDSPASRNHDTTFISPKAN
ncbi:MAG: ubiquinol oxidase subunit II [Pseudomonadota bacterium]